MSRVAGVTSWFPRGPELCTVGSRGGAAKLFVPSGRLLQPVGMCWMWYKHSQNSERNSLSVSAFCLIVLVSEL